MNAGKITKSFYTKNETTKAIVRQTTEEWQYGCAKVIQSREDASDDWVVEIDTSLSRQSTHSLITAYLHCGCGISYTDVDDATIHEWRTAGDEYRVAEVKSPHKELAYELWHVLNQQDEALGNQQREAGAIMLTIVAEQMPLHEVELYAGIVRPYCSQYIINTCLIPDTEVAPYIVLHTSHKECSPLGVPSFLKST